MSSDAVPGGNVARPLAEPKDQDPDDNLTTKADIYISAPDALVASLDNKDELHSIKIKQSHAISNLDTVIDKLTILNKDSAEAYAASAGDFIKAARVAAELRKDLNNLSSKIGSLKAKLESSK